MPLIAKWNTAHGGNLRQLTPEGIYNGTITGVTPEYNVYTQGRTVDRIENTYELDNGHIVKQKYIWYLSETSKLGQVVINLLGNVGHDVDLEQLKGMRCRVKIEHNRTPDGKVWVNVTEVYPIDDEQKVREQAAQEQAEQRQAEIDQLFAE
ncbi:hypothetical protein [Brevibacillus borstelensis]|uniref:hypothetical protein n=1 Tax=Brevibacillus borstelensis TaxID=45462 RepID=UPI001D0AC0F5|nr:hypothetical protein [Brevibacillus borstelensis]MCC0566897.1 hypothetical protein [Brevibacillus borstelensis]